MPALNWGMIQDGGSFESLMHAILYAIDAGTVLFGRPGKDAGQDARSADGTIVYQAKFRKGLVMDGAVDLALEELSAIKKYRQPAHSNYKHWQHAKRWILFANFSINANDHAKWETLVAPTFRQEGLTAEYWEIEKIEGKLAEHPEVRDVFFGGENRVLVGLKEAYDLLKNPCVSNASFDAPLVGREEELKSINSFADSDDKRVLPVVGPAGIGKSRLLYECLVSLSQNGWRVMWALPGTMARSSRWFHLLNGSQKTCVVIDEPEDPGLVSAVIEQLVTVERRNWRVIIAARTEKSELLRRFSSHRMVEKPIHLRPLEESVSKQLLNNLLGGQGQAAWLYTVYKYTKGFPGWLCLIGELAERRLLTDLPLSVDEVASAYVESSMQSLDESRHREYSTLLRWLALWGVLRLDIDISVEEQTEIRFLESQGIQNTALRDLLQKLVGTGLVRNWGIGKRLYTVEPMIIREQVLSSWLLTEDNGMYRVNEVGSRLVGQLVKGEVPAGDSILRTLSRLTISRLTQEEGESFLKPVFDAMAKIASTGTMLDQYRVADLIEKVGAVAPESALDVLATIRLNSKASMDVDVKPWGPQTFTHGALVVNLPWAIYQNAEHVSDFVVARRYLEEFRELVTLEDDSKQTIAVGKGARQLVTRLLCESKNSQVFAQPAQDIAAAEMLTGKISPFVELLLDCLLNPIRKSTEWVSDWTLSLASRALLPGSPEWKIAVNIRELVFDVLKFSHDPFTRTRLWHCLSVSHHHFHRAIMHGDVIGAAVSEYRSVLIDDLKKCNAILKSPPVQLTIEEATHARETWSWYLEYGSSDDVTALAQQCELFYNTISKWRMHDFFQFKTDEDLAPETARIVEILHAAGTPETYADFFAEAKRYLDAARRGNRDSADYWRIAKLADGCADLLSLNAAHPYNAFTTFLVNFLNKPEDENSLAWAFVVRVCQKHLLELKITGDESILREELDRLLKLTPAKVIVLYGLYSNAHPLSTGSLMKAELDYILSFENDFSPREKFILFGTFAGPFWDIVKVRLQTQIDELRDQPVEASICMACFVRASHIAALRYEWVPAQLPIAWIIEKLVEFDLDGALLGMYELTSFRKWANFKLTVTQLLALIEARIELEQRPKPGGHFDIVPYDFKADVWCRFDDTVPAEVAAFHKFCHLALGYGFIALNRMPTYVSQLDASGKHVGSFVETYLSNNPNITGPALARLGYLASAYPDNSEAWACIARPICRQTNKLRKDEREHVYFGLSKKETGVISSKPGEVSDYYIKASETAKQMLASEPIDSPLRPYREWALRCAESDLLREKGWAEEISNG